ncbi:MAG: carboxy terminal-processing peptidase [Planctomycetaceae bacterium]|jgi:carboxyl-terminal processing protease|nr:carboxy terminal-processing peptidase [Planctomycetaceae bacterium]
MRRIDMTTMKRIFHKELKNHWSLLIAAVLMIASAMSQIACNAATIPQEGNSAIGGNLAPTRTDNLIARLISIDLPRRHISKHPLDAEFSKRAFSLYLKALDPMKYYFNQSDIDEFAQNETQLGEQLKSGNLQFAFDVFNRYLKRFDERTAIAEELLKSQQDFTVNESFVVDKEMLTYPKSKEEAFDRCRKKIKFDILVLMAENRDMLSGKNKEDETHSALEKAKEDPIQRLERRYESTKKRIHQTTGDEVLEIYLSSVTGAYDPHSSYMSQKSFDNFRKTIGLNLEGIGALLQGEDGLTLVKSVIPGGPADKDGRLKSGDKIIGVGQGADGEIEEVVDWRLNDVVEKIRGKSGTTVRLEVIPDDGSDKKIIDIVRAKVDLKDSEAQAETFEVGKNADGTPYLVGVIDLPSFYFDMEAAERGDRNPKSTTVDVRAILEKFNEKKVDVVVLRLSKNGGGSLQEAIMLTGLFIESGPVVQLKQIGDERVRAQFDPDSGVTWTGPLVVVTSKFSASASEIFAGAIRDYKRGLVVGDSRTHGKGSVQTVQPLSEPRLFTSLTNPPEYGTLKLTIQQYYLPAGTSPQIKGVPSDVVLPSLTDYMKDISESDLDYPLNYDEVPPSKYPDFGYVSPQIVEVLKKLSAERVVASEDFQRNEKNIKTYTEIKDRKEIPLNEKTFNAERERFNTDKEERKQLEDVINNNSKIKRDYYLDEVMNVAIDYAQLLNEAGVNFPKPSVPSKRSNSLFFF